MNRTDPAIGAARVAGTALLVPAAIFTGAVGFVGATLAEGPTPMKVLIGVLAVWAVCTPFVFWRWTRPSAGWGRVAVVFGLAALVHVPILTSLFPEAF